MGAQPAAGEWRGIDAMNACPAARDWGLAARSLSQAAKARGAPA
jgi:hypothetical protein